MLSMLSTVSYYRPLVDGALHTLALALGGMATALFFGIVCTGFTALGNVWINRLASAYVYFFRGTPLLTQLIAAYYLPAILGLDVAAKPAAILCLGLYYGAYISEILRGSLQAVPHGHIEVARVLGMRHFSAFRRIVLPQVLANAIPALTGQFTSLVKATSLLSLITITELTLQGRIVIVRSHDPLGTYIAIAMIYLLINASISSASVLIEKHYRRYL